MNLPDPYYEEEALVIYCGDCREILPILPVPQGFFLILDPPYGFNYSSSYGASWKGTAIQNDHDLSLRDFVIEWMSQQVMPPNAAIFGSWKSAYPKGYQWKLIWDKGPAFGMGDLSWPFKNSYEEIFLYGTSWEGTRDESVLRGHFQAPSEQLGRQHPNQKPISLYSYLFQKNKLAHFIVDPCFGSGSSLVAAKKLGAQTIGIEIEEKYCAIAVDRLKQSVLPLQF